MAESPTNESPASDAAATIETAAQLRTIADVCAGIFTQQVRDALAELDLELVPEPASQADLDALQAEHYRLFSLDLLPWQSIFIDPSGRLSGAETEAVRAFYSHYNASLTYAEEPDALANELAFLAWLYREQALAWQQGDESAANRFAAVRREFAKRHLGRWIAPFAEALMRQNRMLYDYAMGLALASVSISAQPVGSEHAYELATAPNLFEDEKAGLEDFAGWLLTPCWSGIYLGRGDIQLLGNTIGIPTGFGNRKTMLTNLFRSAAEFGKLHLLIAELVEMIETASRFYALIRDQEELHAVWMVEPWQKALLGARAMLDNLASHVDAGESSA